MCILLLLAKYILLIQRQPTLENASYALAALTAGGGIMGYVRTRSMPSIIAGTAVGVLCMHSPLNS